MCPERRSRTEMNIYEWIYEFINPKGGYLMETPLVCDKLIVVYPGVDVFRNN